MSKIAAVEYSVKVYCHVDLDEGTIVKVVQDEDVEPTGKVFNDSEYLHDVVTKKDKRRARKIAKREDWPVWDRGY